MKNGSPISEASISGSISTGINSTMAFEEWDACMESGLDIWKWHNNEYPIHFKTKIVGFQRVKRIMNNVSEDAVAKHAKRKRKS